MVWTIGSCAMADLVYQFGRTILEGMFKENLVGLPHGDTATRVSGPWLVAGIEWFRPLLGGCVEKKFIVRMKGTAIVCTGSRGGSVERCRVSRS